MVKLKTNAANAIFYNKFEVGMKTHYSTKNEPVFKRYTKVQGNKLKRRVHFSCTHMTTSAA